MYLQFYCLFDPKSLLSFNTFDSNDIQGRYAEIDPTGMEASWDIFSSDTQQGRQSGLKPD